MNWLIIILIVLIVIILFYSYFKNWFLGITTVSTQQSLSTPTPPVLATTFNSPDSTRYSYGIWYYVNTWTAGINKVIFSRKGDILLYLDNSTAELLCVLPPTSYTDPGENVILPSSNLDSTNAIIVTNNFPLQKWVYINVVVDNTIADIYLDGKLVKSVQINQVSPDKTSNLYFGTGYDAYISNFQRWSTPLDPQTVWSTYLAGNGTSSIGTNNYHMNVSLLKDNVEQKSYSIF